MPTVGLLPVCEAADSPDVPVVSDSRLYRDGMSGSNQRAWTASGKFERRFQKQKAKSKLY